MPVIVAPLLQRIGACIQYMKKGLLLSTQVAQRGWNLLPQMEVGVMGQCVCQRVQGELEHSLGQGGDSGGPQQRSSAVIVQWLVLPNQTGAMGETNYIQSPLPQPYSWLG